MHGVSREVEGKSGARRIASQEGERTIVVCEGRRRGDEPGGHVGAFPVELRTDHRDAALHARDSRGVFFGGGGGGPPLLGGGGGGGGGLLFSLRGWSVAINLPADAAAKTRRHEHRDASGEGRPEVTAR